MSYRRFLSFVTLALVGFVALIWLKSSSAATVFLWRLSGGGTRLFPLVSLSALIDSLNPCAFSVLLLTVAFLVSLGAVRSSIMRIGASYILGIFTAYLFIGLGILQALHLFNTPHFMGKVGAGLLVVLGLVNLINEFFPSFPVKLKIPTAAHGAMAMLMSRASIPATFLLGALVGLCEFPCTGGPYLMVLGLLHDQRTFVAGFWYLVWYNLLFVLPLVVVLALASDRTLLGKLEEWRRQNLRATRLVGGIIMVALGLLIFVL